MPRGNPEAGGGGEISVGGRLAPVVVLGRDDEVERVGETQRRERLARLGARRAGDDRLGEAGEATDRGDGARHPGQAQLGDDALALLGGAGDHHLLRPGQPLAEVGAEQVVDLVPRVTHDEVAVGLGDVDAEPLLQRARHRLGRLALAVDQRPVQIEEEGGERHPRLNSKGPVVVPRGADILEAMRRALLCLLMCAAPAWAQSPLDTLKKEAGKAATSEGKKAANKAVVDKVNAKLLAEGRKNQCSFKVDSDELAPGCDAKARRLANTIIDAKKTLATTGTTGWKFVVYGHTDTTGNADHNKELSKKRAAAIAR